MYLQTSRGEHPFACKRINDSEITFGTNHHQNENTRSVAKGLNEHVHFAEEISEVPTETKYMH